MNQEEFQKFMQTEQELKATFDNIASQLPRIQQTFGTPIELAAIAILFPVAQFIVAQIGLPWLHETGRFSEIYRQKFHRWIDEQYTNNNLDPETAEAAGDALVKKLEATTESGVRAAWERFAGLLKKDDKGEGAE